MLSMVQLKLLSHVICIPLKKVQPWVADQNMLGQICINYQVQWNSTAVTLWSKTEVNPACNCLKKKEKKESTKQKEIKKENVNNNYYYYYYLDWCLVANLLSEELGGGGGVRFLG